MLHMYENKGYQDVAKKAIDVAGLSQCSKKQVGAVVTTKSLMALGIGWNHNPGHISSGHCEHADGTTKDTVIHAETAAISCMHNAYPRGIPGLKIFITHKPCVACLKDIANAGIREIVVVQEDTYYSMVTVEVVTDPHYDHRTLTHKEITW